MLTLLVNKASLSTLHRILSTVSLACPHKVVTFSGTVGEIPPAPVVVAMGGHALNKLKELGLVKKNLSLTSNRGKVIPVGETSVLLTFDPTLALREAERLPDIQWDLQLGSRFAATGSLAPQVGVYRYVPSLAAVVGRLFAEADAAPRQVSLDLETIGLDPFAPEARVVSITVTSNAGQSSVYLPPEGKLSSGEHEALRLLVTSPLFKLVGANLKFDALWLAVHYGIWIGNHKLDTQLVGSLLDENRSNSLNVHAKVYVPALGGYDDAMNRTHDKSRMDLVLEQDPEGFLTYAGGDTDACYRVANIMRTRISTDARLRNFYTRLLHPASTAFTKLEYRGVVVDRERYSELQAECEAEIATLEHAAIDLMPRRLRYKHLHHLALTRPQVIKDFMFGPTGLGLKPLVFTEKGGEPSTAADHLQMFSDVPEAAEFVRILGQYSVAKKILSTYIVGFLKHLRADGRFHPSYRLSRGGTIGDAEAGTLTGRLSASDPAWQTVPKRSAWAKRLRSVYVPPSGYGILQVDFSQGELRIIADLANEPTMLRAYRDGLDLHAITAAETMGLTFEKFLTLSEAVIEEKRRAAKAINFGLAYGMGAEGLQDYSRKSYGVVMSLTEATESRDRYFTLYNALPKWHAAYKEAAHKHEQIRSPLGRIRHLPLINGPDQDIRAMQERQAVNSPVQSTLSDMALLSMVELDRAYPDLWVFGMTHDSLEIYAPEDDLEGWAYRVRDVMENLPLGRLGWSPKVRFTVDAGVSLVNLAELTKVGKSKA